MTEVGRRDFTLVLTVLNLSEFPPLHSPNPVSRPMVFNAWLCARVNEQEVPCWRVSFVYFQFTWVIKGTVSIARGYCLLYFLIIVETGTIPFVSSHPLSRYQHSCLTFYLMWTSFICYMVKVATCALYSFPATSCLNAILFFSALKSFLKGSIQSVLKRPGSILCCRHPWLEIKEQSVKGSWGPE